MATTIIFAILSSFVLSTVNGIWLLEERLNDFKTTEIAKAKQTQTQPGFVWLNTKSANLPVLWLSSSPQMATTHSDDKTISGEGSRALQHPGANYCLSSLLFHCHDQAPPVLTTHPAAGHHKLHCAIRRFAPCCSDCKSVCFVCVCSYISKATWGQGLCQIRQRFPCSKATSLALLLESL